MEFGDSLEPQSFEFRVVIEDTEQWEGGGKMQASQLTTPTPIRTVPLLHTLCNWGVARYFV